MSQLHNSSARRSSVVAAGRAILPPPWGRPATYSISGQMYDDRRAWGALVGVCDRHAPARLGQGRAHVRIAGLVQFSTSRLVGLRNLGAGFGRRPFGLRGRVNARLANYQSADDLICHLSQPLPSHSKTSASDADQLSDGASQDVGPTTQGLGNA